MSDGGFRSWANVAKFRKMLREVAREGVPREIGPTVSVQEAMAMLGRSETYVRNRLADGKLNAWKDPVSRRLHVRLEEVEWLRARQETGDKRQETRAKAADAREENEEDDGKPWSWDDVCAAQVVDEWAAESERRYQARLAELMAEIEPGTDEDKRQETGDKRQEQVEAEGGEGAPDAPASSAVSPVSCLLSPVSCLLSPVSCLPVARPFPVGWVGWRVAAAMLDIGEATLNQMARAGKLERRRVDGKGPWLYDSVQVECLAAQRLASLPRPDRHESVRWWGSRREAWELGPFDYWMTTKEAAETLGVRPERIGDLCRRGLLPARQAHPGKRGSRLWVPNTRVMTLKQQPEHLARRAAWEKGKGSVAQPVGWEALGIAPVDSRAESAGSRRNHGEFYSTRQAALRLDISMNSVRTLRERGRLTGVHVKRRHPSSSACQWWFYRKEDVDALAGDTMYLRNSRRGKEAQRIRPA